MADFCEILFNLKSIKLKFHVPCDQHSTAQELMPTWINFPLLPEKPGQAQKDSSNL